MSQKILFTGAIVFFSLLAFTGCKKDKVPSEPGPGGTSPCEDVRNIKHYFDFKPGSWWVYVEETSGDRDSVYITQEWNDPNTYDFDIRMYSTFQDYYYHFWPSTPSVAQGCGDAGVICQQCISVNRSKYKPGEFIGEGKCFLYQARTGSYDHVPNVYFTNNQIIVDSIFSTFQLSGLSFNRTFCIRELSTFIEGVQPTNHYFSENVGLIRKELLDSGQVWNLVNYHIEN